MSVPGLWVGLAAPRDARHREFWFTMLSRGLKEVCASVFALKGEVFLLYIFSKYREFIRGRARALECGGRGGVWVVVER